MSSTTNWFTVDRDGLAAILEAKGKSFALTELVQNAWDEEGVTHVQVLAESVGRGRVRLTVEDDAPAGWADLTHAHTLFAPSKKKDDPTLRGRYNLGEKLVLALAVEAEIVTTTGGVRFDGQGRHTLRSRQPVGSRFDATLRMTQPELVEALAVIRSVLVPQGILLEVNGATVAPRVPLAVTAATLPTVVADEDGNLRPTKRATTVHAIEALGEEVPHLYEMGIPVCPIDTPWHLDVQQKVPLSLDRDTVTPGYRKALITAVLDATVAILNREQATATWVTDALEGATTEAVAQVVTKRYGAGAVVTDPSNPEATKRAIDQGRTVIPGNAFTRTQWGRVRETGMARPAGQVIKTAPTTSPDGRPPTPEKDWTPAMRSVARYVRRITKALIEVEDVEFQWQDVRSERYRAWFHRSNRVPVVTYNLAIIGRRRVEEWADGQYLEDLDDLILHEAAHQRADDHFTDLFHGECTRLGAKLRRLKGLPIVP